jgi:3-isopropylmalate/(R)-2-methylmalate dehydratase small subunit
MQPLTVVTGPAVPLMLANVDTDVIIRIERLTSLDRHALGRYAFEALRHRADGEEDPDCVLNRPEYRNAPLLIADANFGCGSSREGAVWALQAIGVRCIVAPSFGDIFFNNCFQNGVLPIRLPADAVRALATQAWRAAEGARFTVDLVHQHIVAPDGTVTAFVTEALRRDSLLAGLDDIGLTLQHVDAIDAWEALDQALRPWNWSAPVRATPHQHVAIGNVPTPPLERLRK